MKKYLIASLLTLANYAGASSTQLQSATMTAEDASYIAKTASFLYGQDQSLTYTASDRRLAVDSNGYLKFIHGGGGAILGVSVTASVAYVSVSSPAYDILTSTASSYNITSVAGTSANYDVGIVNNGGSAGVRFKFSMSATAPSDLSARGNYIAGTSTTQVMGPFAPGMHIHLYSIGVNPTGSNVTLDLYRRGFNSANP